MSDAGAMHFAIRYVTEYRYSQPASDNLNALRVRPADTPSQTVEDFDVRVSPEARLHRHVDWFGTQVIEFGVVRPHEALSVDVRARVATTPPADPPEAPWEALAADAYQARAAEFLLPYDADHHDGRLDALVTATRATTPLATLKLLCELVPDRFAYRQGVTYVGSTVGDLLDAGAGVCQDFVHLSLVLLRRHGIAARYVSGYLWAPGGDDDEDSIEVDTHAWVEALLPGVGGERAAWVGGDPTNRALAGVGHVKVGHGRHYADVPPTYAVFCGGGESRLRSSVRMTRVDAATAARA